MNYSSKPTEKKTINDLSYNEIIVMACEKSNIKAMVYTSIWDIIIRHASTIHPGKSSYEGAKKLFKTRGFEKRKKYEHLIDHFWLVVQKRKEMLGV